MSLLHYSSGFPRTLVIVLQQYDTSCQREEELPPCQFHLPLCKMAHQHIFDCLLRVRCILVLRLGIEDLVLNIVVLVRQI